MKGLYIRLASLLLLKEKNCQLCVCSTKLQKKFLEIFLEFLEDKRFVWDQDIFSELGSFPNGFLE